MNDNIEFGDEVQNYNTKGEPRLGTRFIVTDMGYNYIAGIDFSGEIYSFDIENTDNWQKTGRHYDILGALRKLRDETNH